MLWLPSKQHTPATLFSFRYLCTVYVPYMSLICPLYVPDMSLICPLYVPYMSLICRQQRSSRLGTCAQMPRKLRSEEDSGLMLLSRSHAASSDRYASLCKFAVKKFATGSISIPLGTDKGFNGVPSVPQWDR